MPSPSAAQKANFQTLRTAVLNGDVVLMDCQIRETKQSAAVLCAVNVTSDAEAGRQFEFVPLAMLLDGNPYELLSPPDPDGGYCEPQGDDGSDQ